MVPQPILQGFRREPSLRESKLRVGNYFEVVVEKVGDVTLVLSSDFELVLKNTFYIPSFRRNLISVICLDRQGFKFTIGDDKINLMLDSQIVGYGSIDGVLYKLFLASDNIPSSLVVENSIAKRSKVEEKSFKLWHKRLGHISRERVERLSKENILPTLDFDDLGTCVDCIRGKYTKRKKIGATRSSNLLEIIHTDISGPLTPTICGNKYFITFIDDFSRYGYLYLIKEKSEVGS